MTNLTAEKLQAMTEDWVNKTFNFIQHNLIINSLGDDLLIDYIRPMDHEEDFLIEYDLQAEFEDSELDLYDFCGHHESFDDFVSEREGENYPMWNTLFEFRSEPSEEVIQAAIKSGFGVVEGLEDLNTTLFVAGAGYSFYAQHWIPLFLSMPWNEDLKKEVEANNITYKHM